MKQIQKRGKTNAWKYTATVRLHGYSVTQTFPFKQQATEWADRVEIAIKDELAKGIPFDKNKFVAKKREPTKSKEQIAEEQKLIDLTPSVEWTLKRAIKEYMLTELDDLKGFKQAYNRLKAWEKHEFADIKLKDLSPELLATYVREKEKSGLSGSTIRNNIFRISAIFELAIKPLTKHGWNLDLENPVKKIALPQMSASRQVRFNSYDEEVLFMALEKGMYADQMIPFVILALESGMRKSEILGITKKEINKTKRGWNIRKTDTKNGQPRLIYLSKKAEEAIKERYKNLENDESPLFTISSDTVSNWFKRATDKAGLHNIRLHDLRHEAVSRLADKGLSVGAIANQSGHRSMQTLLRYVNAKESDIREKLEQSN